VQSSIRIAFFCGALATVVCRPAGAKNLHDAEAAFKHGDYATALRILLPLAGRDDAAAESALGIIYLNGKGVEPDWAEAEVWLRKAADQGDANAQVALAYSYVSGRISDPADYLEAYKWMSIAALDGSNATTQPAIQWRDRIAERLTAEQRATADRWVEHWRPALETQSQPVVRAGRAPSVTMTDSQRAEAHRVELEWKLARITADPAERVLANGDITLGSPRAPVTMTEYTATYCPTCARFDERILPTFRAKYIDTGQVRLVRKEVLVGVSVEAGITASLLARCTGNGRYFSVLNAISASPWYPSSPDLITAGLLPRIARSVGLSEARFKVCISDENARAPFRARAKDAMARDHIIAAPTFIVGTHRIIGAASLEELGALIAQAPDTDVTTTTSTNRSLFAPTPPPPSAIRSARRSPCAPTRTGRRTPPG